MGGGAIGRRSLITNGNANPIVNNDAALTVLKIQNINCWANGVVDVHQCYFVMVRYQPLLVVDRWVILVAPVLGVSLRYGGEVRGLTHAHCNPSNSTKCLKTSILTHVLSHLGYRSTACERLAESSYQGNDSQYYLSLSPLSPNSVASPTSSAPSSALSKLKTL